MKSLLQEIRSIHLNEQNYTEPIFKRLDYEYELISGNVKQVHFQRGEADGFSHRYSYDTDNRITQVETSTDEVIWNKEANYDYYAHGPLARVKTGRDDIDQCDYAYTLHGWLKGVQSQNFAYALGYYNTATEQDYTPIGTASLEATPMSKNLYNGNISTMTTHTPAFAQEGMQTTFTKQFTYDQLNRITSSQLAGGGNNFRTSYSYDANGNIDTLNRWDKNGNQFDAMVYNYHQIDKGYLKNTNRLRWVDDNPATNTVHTDDIEDQSRDNYSYDDIGNLIADASEEIERIEWTAYGKVAAVIRTVGSNQPNMYFSYDVMGNRTAKKVVTSTNTITTYYILDATGNTISTYKKESTSALEIQDRYLYGSSRLGNYSSTAPAHYQLTDGITRGNHQLGLRSYELNDHLGNVHVVLSDRKVAGAVNALAAYEYYPFGFSMQQIDGKYRYGFNGQEKDPEIHEGSYTAMFWQYDSRLGRRWNQDPKPNPSISNYVTFAGNPMWYSDPLGDTVRTRFSNKALKELGVSKDDLKTGQVPDKLKDVFQKEYGINVGITHLKGKTFGLTYEGEAGTDLIVSSSAKSAWKEALSGNVTDWRLDFTHRFDGDPHNTGMKVRINLSDFDDNDYAANFLDYSGYRGDDLSSLRRSTNLARIMEHEIFGHGYYGTIDYKSYEDETVSGEGLYRYSMQTSEGLPYGQTAWGITNSFRIEMGLREYQRLNYTTSDYSGIIFGDPDNSSGKIFYTNFKD